MWMVLWMVGERSQIEPLGNRRIGPQRFPRLRGTEPAVRSPLEKCFVSKRETSQHGINLGTLDTPRIGSLTMML